MNVNSFLRSNIRDSVSPGNIDDPESENTTLVPSAGSKTQLQRFTYFDDTSSPEEEKYIEQSYNFFSKRLEFTNQKLQDMELEYEYVLSEDQLK